jgi:Enterobacteriaceae phage serine recombinase
VGTSGQPAANVFVAGIDTTTPTGRAMRQMSVVAELERSLIIERTRAGMQAARSRGIRPGQEPSLTRQQIASACELRAKGKAPDAIAGILRVSRATVYRALT